MYESFPDSGNVVLEGRVYDGRDVRIYYEDISLCVDTPEGMVVLWRAPEPQQSKLSPNGLALVKLQIALSSLYPKEGLARNPGELQRLQAEARTLAEVDSILPSGGIYKVYFASDDGIPTYWESFIRGPFPEQYVEHPETFVPSVGELRNGIRAQLRFTVDSLRTELDGGGLVVFWQRERRPGMQVFRENQEEVLGEIFALRNNQQVEIKYLNLEAADAVRRW
jgi:hypothetical protein